MKPIDSLIKNKNTLAGVFYLFGNIFDKAIVFFTIPIFTRLMSSSDYGIVNTYMSWVSILSLIVGLSLGSSLRNAYMDFKNHLEEYISSILFLSLLNFLVTSAIIIFICFYFFEQLDISLVILCLIQSFMTFIINTVTIKYMMSLDFIKRTLLLAIPNTLVAILSIVLLMNMGNNLFLGRIIPYVLITSLIGTFYLIQYFAKGKKFINKKFWKYALSLSVPLIFHGLSMNVLNASDRTMITVYRNASETGIYSLVYSFSMIALVVTSSLGSVWIPWFNKKLQSGETDLINKFVKLYIEIIMIVMIVLLVIGPEILEIMSPPEYWSGKILIAPILLASFFIFLYSISVDLEYYYKSTKIIAINTVIAAAINLILNFIFIPRYGYIAAAYTTVVAYIISFLIHYHSARKLNNQLFPFKIYLKPIVIMFFAVCISYILMDNVIVRWSLAIIGMVLYTIISLKSKRFFTFFNNH